VRGAAGVIHPFRVKSNTTSARVLSSSQTAITAANLIVPDPGVVMKLSRFLAFLPLALLLGGCGNPVPPERSDYVGEWKHPAMYLLITQDGSVRYRRIRGGATTSIDGPLRSFDGANFEVGIWPMVTTFEVATPPHQRAGTWYMVVDGLELQRSAR
jgi:hypothetical protein